MSNSENIARLHTSLQGVAWQTTTTVPGDADSQWWDGYDAAHDHADRLAANLPVDEYRTFLIGQGIDEDEIPDDEDDVYEMVLDTTHQMAADAVNSGTVEDFLTR